MKSEIYLTLVFISFAGYFSNCSRTIESYSCHSQNSIELINGNCLIFNHQGKLDHLETSIAPIVQSAISSINRIVPIEKIRVVIEGPQNGVIKEIGIGGFNPNKDEIFLRIDPNHPSISFSLEKYLAALIAHEIHHAIRRRKIGYGDNLLEAMISEGMADCFSMEITGIKPPPWSVALSPEELQNWLKIAQFTWKAPEYNHENWFFGTSNNIPRWAGYSIGFHLIKEYIKNNPITNAADLIDQPAKIFINN